MEELEVMFNNEAEKEFLFSALTPNSRVLEWGSGGSTIQIAKRCQVIHSIEHEKIWCDRVAASLSEINHLTNGNHHIFYIPKNSEEAPGHDGTFSNYRDYVNYPKRLNIKYDVILIDGRARVYCANVALDVLAKNGCIFIHDYRHPQPEYRRPEYEVVEEFLTLEEQVFTLAKFRKP